MLSDVFFYDYTGWPYWDIQHIQLTRKRFNTFIQNLIKRIVAYRQHTIGHVADTLNGVMRRLCMRVTTEKQQQY